MLSAQSLPHAPSQAIQCIRFGRCEVRPAQRLVLVDGRPRELQPRAFDLLLYLIQHRERVLSCNELLDAVWGPRIVEPNSLAVAIKRIRSALHDDHAAIVRTHHRKGYRFAAALEGEAGPALSGAPLPS